VLNSIKARIALSAGLAMIFTLLIAMGMTTNAFTQVNQQIIAKVKDQLTDTTNLNLKSTASEQGKTIANQLFPVLANLDQIRSIIELSGKTGKGADHITDQFIAALEAQDKAVFAGYMVWEEKTWSLDSEVESGKKALNKNQFLAPFFSPNPNGSFDIVAMDSFSNEKLNSNGERTDDWHLAPFETGKTFVMEPYLYDVRGKQELITTISQPININGRTVGSLGFDLSLFELQGQSEHIAKDLFDGEGHIIITSWKGIILANSDDVNQVGKKISPDIMSQWSSIQNLSTSSDVGLVTIAKSEYAVTSVDTGANAWVVLVSVPTKKLAESIVEFSQWSEDKNDSAIAQGIVAGLIAAIIGITIMTLIASSLGKALSALVERFKDVAQGDGDLTVRIDVKGKDERAQLAFWFNTFLERLQGTLKTVMTTANQVDASAVEGKEKSEHSQTKLVAQVSEIDSLATAITEMSSAAQEIARSAVQAAESASHVQETSSKGMGQVDNSVISVDQLTSKIDDAQEQVKNLVQSNAAIQGILSEIGSIAEQTNLLALNAAIEAARAGEAGRGFAVVADEVRNLATRTQSSTEEIRTMLNRLEQETQSVVSLMQQSQEQAVITKGETTATQQVLTDINSAIDTINDMNNQIASAAEEQSSVTEEINRNVVFINDAAVDVMDSITSSCSISDELAVKATDLHSELNQFKI